MKSFRYNKNAGFTLLELSISLLIIASVIGGGIAILNNSVSQKQYNETIFKMQAIQDAVSKFRNAYGRIPCPAIISSLTTAAAFGTEIASAGACDTSVSFTTGVGSNTRGGLVPIKTLQLPDEYAFDGWGRRIMYIVDKRFTATDAFTTYPVTDIVTGDIKIEDITGIIKEPRAIQVLISYGKNGHGARNRYGTGTINASSVNTNELDNCHCTNTAAAATFDVNFVQGSITPDPATPTNGFDDITFFNSRSTLVSPSE